MATLMTDDRLITAKEVADYYGLKREVTVREWAKAGRIPKPVVQRQNYTRWSRNEILADIERMKNAERSEMVA